MTNPNRPPNPKREPTPEQQAADQFAAQAVKSAMERALDGLLVFDELEKRPKLKG